MISIITVTKNNPEDLRRTLNSIGSQTLTDVEIIIVDGDEDADSSYSLASEVVFFPRTFVVLAGPDNGIAHAFNKGLAVAKGDIINYLNAGDAFVDESVLSKVSDSYSRLEWAWAFGWRNRVDAQGRVFPPRANEKNKAVTRERFFSGSAFISHQATFVSRRACAAVSKYDEAYMFYAMDIDYLCRLWIYEAPVQIAEVLVNYDVTGISSRNFIMSLREKKKVLLRWTDGAAKVKVEFIYYRTLLLGLMKRRLRNLFYRVIA